MIVRHDVPLAPLTTLGLGGPARRLVTAFDEADVCAAVAEADRIGEPILVLGGGSNLVLPDAGVTGTVIRVVPHGRSARPEPGGAEDAVLLEVSAGEPWDAVVEAAVADGLAGVECLSGIPGLSGATPIQNVGAYGQEVAQTVTAVRVFDRRRREVEELSAADCRFGYRSSAFKSDAGRYVVLAVRFRLRVSDRSEPVRYPELARALGVQPGDRAPLPEVRSAVLALRRGKGMVLDPSDPDSRSVGSFFTNPLLSTEQFADLRRRAQERLGTAEVPGYPAGDGTVKVSAAWLIEAAGFTRGHGSGAVGISGKHSLALVHRGGGTTAELLALAGEIRDGVRSAFCVDLVPEPVIVGADR